MAQRLKRLPAMRGTWVQSLSQEDPLEEEMAPHSSILAWKIPWMEELVGYSPRGRKELDTTERLHFHFHLGTRDSKIIIIFFLKKLGFIIFHYKIIIIYFCYFLSSIVKLNIY